MSVGSKAVASVLDVIFGDTFIASIYNSSRFFDMMFNLIILACYIYLFKHFCSFLTNMLTSMLNFDGQGFSKNTGGTAFQSGDFMEQITSATNYKAIEGANKGFIKRTAGFRNLDKYTGLSNFTMFDGNRFSLKKTFDTGFGVIKTTSSSIYNGITKKSQESFKEFVQLREKIRENKRMTKPDSIAGLDFITNNKELQYLLEQISSDKIGQDEINAYKKRLELIMKQNLSNLAKRNMNKTTDKNTGGKTGHFETRSRIYANDYRFASFEKNKKENSKVLSKLAKLSRDGYFDMSTIGAGDLDLQKLINGEISDEDYKIVQDYIRAQGLRSTNRAIFNNISENIQLIKGTELSREELDSLTKISKGKDLEETRSLITDTIYEKIMKKERKRAVEKERKKESREERREREERIRQEVGEIKTDYGSVSEELETLERNVRDKLDEDARKLLEDKEITLCDTDITCEGHIIIGYTDDNIILYLKESGEIGAAQDIPDLVPHKEELVNLSAAVEPETETEEESISQTDQQTIDYSEALMRATNIRKKIAEYQLSLLENGDGDPKDIINHEDMVKQLEEKSKKLEKRIKSIEGKKNKK